MKIYEYHLKVKTETGEPSYLFYAFTKNKKLAKEFENMRDMTKFKKVKEEISEDMYNEFERSNYQKLLSRISLITRAYSENDVTVPQEVNVVMTYDEYDTCSDVDINIPIYDKKFWDNFFDVSYAFNDKITEGLKFFQFFSLGKTIIARPIPYDSEFDDYNAPDYTLDTLAVFINFYKNTLKL